MTAAEFVPDREGMWHYDPEADVFIHESGHSVKASHLRLVNADCGYGVMPEPWHHEYGPPMVHPGEGCER